VKVIGDTPADLGMGKRAQLGATVGVLSGVGEPMELQEEADHLVSGKRRMVDLCKNIGSGGGCGRISQTD
jgi:phosphoglycolate phosphatase-like HAD superfamily hydrolase